MHDQQYGCISDAIATGLVRRVLGAMHISANDRSHAAPELATHPAGSGHGAAARDNCPRLRPGNARTRLAAQRAESRVYALIHQGIAALPLTQSYTREEHEQRRFAEETDRAQKSKMSQHGLEVVYWFVVSVILCVNTALVTWFGARQVLAGTLTLGELLVFLSYMT